LKTLIPALIIIATLSGCGDPEEPGETITFFLEVSWPENGTSVKFDMPVDTEILNTDTKELERRVSDILTKHDEASLFKTIENAAGVSNAAQKVVISELNQDCIEITWSLPSTDLAVLPDRNLPVPDSSNRAITGVVSKTFVLHPVSISVREECSVEEKSKIESSLKEMHCYSLRLGKETQGYFTGKTGKGATRAAMKFVIAHAHTAVKKAQPLITGDCPFCR